MAKAKGKKGPIGGVNSHLRARINYLYNAAAYLQAAHGKPGTEAIERGEKPWEHAVMTDSNRIVPAVPTIRANTHDRAHCIPQLARGCISQMRGVSLKSQLRLPVEQKRSLCKRCNTLLIPGNNCTEETRNPSRGSRKSWAEVRIVRCNICGTDKRFPQTNRRSSKLSERRKGEKVKYEPESAKPT
ncbi:ribonuclease P Rpr2/Rpp21/SNM1 subunit [Aspergillus lucknowensis]|uniref:RNAse P Rpr2/Rpp21/SNM1 subunit domain-containing protein n=1 Tax=Aspergillus lucknowensis TaxID=176173 RepID=A0ABR4M4K3_9EURO